MHASPPSSADRTVSELASSPVQQNILGREGMAKGMDPVGDGGVTGRPRRGGQRVIPDLAKTGVVPADHMKSGLGRAGGGECGETKSGNGTKNGKSTHVEIFPREK